MLLLWLARLTGLYLRSSAWNPAKSHNFSQKEMETKFPKFADMFHELAKPGVHHDAHHDDDDERDDHDDHDGHDGHGQAYDRRPYRRFRARRFQRRF